MLNNQSKLVFAIATAAVGVMSFGLHASAQVVGGTDGVEIPVEVTAASAAMHAQFDYANGGGDLTLLSAAAAVGSDTAAMASPTFSAAVGTTSVVDGLIDTGALNDSLMGQAVTDGAIISFTNP